MSITDLGVAAILRQAVLVFERRNARLPSAGARRNITHLVEHLHLHLSVRCSDTDCRGVHDLWDLDADPRIPQREHEPRHDLSGQPRRDQPGLAAEGVVSAAHRPGRRTAALVLGGGAGPRHRAAPGPA